MRGESVRRYPLFRAADDVSALAELTELLGTAAVQRAAAHLGMYRASRRPRPQPQPAAADEGAMCLSAGRRVVTSVRRPGLCLRKLSAHLRGAAPPRAPPPAAPPCARCRRCAARCLCPDEDVPVRRRAGLLSDSFIRTY